MPRLRDARSKNQVLVGDLDKTAPALAGRVVPPLVGETADAREVLLKKLRRTVADYAEARGVSAEGFVALLRERLGRKPRILDLFCGGGGATVGYCLAGFEVIGCDTNPSSSYPGGYWPDDAMAVLNRFAAGKAHRGYKAADFDAFHASPPCQQYSRTRHIHPEKTDAMFPDLINPVREYLVKIGKPWVLENVVTAPMGARAKDARMQHCIMLCGLAFGLKVYRHRLFESNELIMAQPHKTHRLPVAHSKVEIEDNPHAMLMPAGHFACYDRQAAAMGIDWGMTRDELAEAIPPAYTRYLGNQLAGIIMQRSEK